MSSLSRVRRFKLMNIILRGDRLGKVTTDRLAVINLCTLRQDLSTANVSSNGHEQTALPLLTLCFG